MQNKQVYCKDGNVYEINIEDYEKELQQENEELQRENKLLTSLVISPFRYEVKCSNCGTPNYIFLTKKYYKMHSVLVEFENWLETNLILEKAQQTDKMYIKGFQECLDKLQELKGGKDE